MQGFGNKSGRMWFINTHRSHKEGSAAVTIDI